MPTAAAPISRRRGWRGDAISCASQWPTISAEWGSICPIRPSSTRWMWRSASPRTAAIIMCPCSSRPSPTRPTGAPEQMHVDWSEWLNLALRWLHLITGIAWIGSSFYFVWLDNHLQKPASGDASGEVWSVHGGGFYHKQKYQVAPAAMPEDLHWFKYEAYFTWISGFSLLVLIYYFGAQSYLIDPTRAQLSTGAGIAIGLSALVLGWLVYDLLCRSPLGQNNVLLGIFWFVCLLFAAHLLNSLFNPRAAYIHVGAMIGTAMVANVFLVIIPNQKKVVADLIAGRTPDPKLGAQAKQRSLHNNYMTLPVLFIMISNHYPMTYGAERPWLVMA